MTSSGVAPRSRRIAPESLALLHDDAALVRAVRAGRGLAGGLRQHGDVLGNDARLEAGIGVERRIGRGISEPARIDAGECVGRRHRAGIVRGLAHLAHHLVHRHQRGESQARHRAHEIAGDERDFGVGCGGSGRLLGRRGFDVHHVGEHALRIEGRDLRRQLRRREREVARDLDERADPRDLAFAHLGHGGEADDVACRVGLDRRRQAVALAGGAIALDGARFGALGRRREMRLAVEGCENGASHQGGAAQAGEDRAGKPADRHPAPVEVLARPAVDRQRRFVAELDRTGLLSRCLYPLGPLAVIQNARSPVPAAQPLEPPPPSRPSSRPETTCGSSRYALRAGARPAPLLDLPGALPGHVFGSNFPFKPD